MTIFQELKRRNVFRVGIAYIVLSWLLLQVTDVIVPILELPDWVARLVLFLLAIGFPVVLFFAWAFELTPEGVKREKEVDRSLSITTHTGKKLDRAIIGILTIAVALLLFEQFRGESPETAPTAEPQANAVAESEASSSQAKSIAVLPFVAMSSGSDDEYFADGLTEEILNSLAQLPELLVTARTSAFHFKGKDVPVSEIAASLGVEHVVEGSVRRSGERLRVTAQLIRAADGFHLWSETYDSVSTDTIAVQEDIAVKIATAMDVVLDEERRETMRKAGLRDVEAFIAFQKGRELFQEAHGLADQITPLLEANRYFDEVLERVPGYPPALILHADAYSHITTAEIWRNDPQQYRETMLEARDQLVADLNLAAKNARTFDEGAAIEFDLMVTTGNLCGIRSRLQNYLASDSCQHPNWVDSMAIVFGYTEQLQQRLARVLECDPMEISAWFSQARAAQWAGDPDTAMEIITEARSRFTHDWLDFALVSNRIIMGEFETAASDAALLADRELDEIVYKSTAAATRGDADAVQAYIGQIEQLSPGNNFLKLQHNAMAGNRAEANRIAANVDRHALGPLPLILATLWCYCGAPFDLEATPNFAASLAESGLDWPPVSAIRFPLKDW